MKYFIFDDEFVCLYFVSLIFGAFDFIAVVIELCSCLKNEEVIFMSIVYLVLFIMLLFF